MIAGLAGVALLLLLSLGFGLLRIWRGPGFADRMLAAQLLGTTGIAILLVLAVPLNQPTLQDVALVLAVLAVLAVVAFVARVWEPDDDGPGNGNGEHSVTPTGEPSPPSKRNRPGEGQ
jgi:multicomponent Na+:H+ antiporter subunit F